MFEFIILSIAVIAVMATRWEKVSPRQLGLSGALSAALGMRVFALALSGYLAVYATAAAADDAKPESTTEPTAEASVEPKTSGKPLLAEAEGTAPATSQNAKAEPKSEPKSEEAQSGVETATVRPPVEFVTKVKYLSPNRPVWLEAAPNTDGQNYLVAVRAGPYRTVRDCERDLDREVRLATAEFINDHLNAPHAATLLNYSLKDLRGRKVVREQFSEQLETSLGLMSQVHALLVFDDGFRDELDERWSELRSKSRLAQAGLGSGIVLLFLGTLFSFLKLDTATKGYYTGRLQIGAAVTILALVAASVLLSKWIPWM